MLSKVCVVFILLIIAYNSYAEKAKVFVNFEASYKVGFEGFVAGKGVLRATFDNSTYKISFEGKTVSPLRWFYRLKVKIEDSISVVNNRDLYYISFIRTPKKVKRVIAKFDNKTSVTVLYEKNGNKKIYKLFSKEGLYSPLSIYLFFITHKVTLGKIYYKDVIVSKKIYRVKIKPLKISTINIDIFKRAKGKRKALKAELSFYKVVGKGKTLKQTKIKDLVVWVSCKSPRIPLLVKMRYYIGDFEARLVSLKVF